MYFILGIHPCDGLKCTPACLDAIQEAFANDSRLAAVGEIGLDFHWNDCPRELQYQAFARQLEMAKKAGKPVVIHCREAERNVLRCWRREVFRATPCFGTALEGMPASRGALSIMAGIFPFPEQ